VSSSLISFGGKTLIQAFHRDITERKQTEDALKQSEAHYRLLADHMTDTIALLDLNLRTTYISPSIEKLMGYTLDEIQQVPGYQNFTPAPIQAVIDYFAIELPKVMADPTYSPKQILELEFLRKDGSVIWTETRFSIIRDENGNPVSILSEGRDITERKQTEAKLRQAKEALEVTHRELEQSFMREQQLARIDVLTGVNSRNYLFELASHEFEVAMRRPPLSMLMIDIDHFKQINDTFGHAMGDQAIKHIAQIVYAEIRSADVIGRYGAGDEFVILLPQTSTQEARSLAERIHASIAAMRLDTGKGALTVTISIGVAQTIHDAAQTDTVESLLHRADTALYAAKQAGRNRTVIFDPNTIGAG
jgi:diguanylate cyclase (GGDEF)-like protein/PAS domain S-box-containing protein